MKTSRRVRLVDPISRRPDVTDGSQAYFRNKEWRAGEREASEEIANGQAKRFRSAAALIRDLKR